MNISDVPLVRTDGLQIIHREDCHQMRREYGSEPVFERWPWAEDRDLAHVRDAAPMIGSQACPHCQPFLPFDQRREMIMTYKKITDPDAVDDLIAQWDAGAGGSMTLSEYLGWTLAEFVAWYENGVVPS